MEASLYEFSVLMFVALNRNNDHIVAKYAGESEKRQNPMKAQYDAKEPDRRKFKEEEEE